jgi:exosortase
MRQRALAWTSAIVMLAAAGALYAPVVAGLVRQWIDEPDTSYGALLAATAAIVFVRRRARLRAIVPAPSNAGFVVLAFALAIYTLGSLIGDLFLTRLSLPAAIAGMVIALGGTPYARAVGAALGLLLLAIPLPGTIVTHLTLPLQLMGSHMAAGLLALCGIPVVREGNLLVLPHITLEVAEACSGLQSVTALVSVAAVCGALVPLSAARTVFLMIVAVPIAIVGNGVRVAATGLLTTWIGEVAVHGTIHELTGFVAFFAMCAAAFAIDAVTRSRLEAFASPRAGAWSASV